MCLMSFWDSVSQAILLEEAARKEKLCIVWPDSMAAPVIRPIEKKNDPILVMGERSFDQIRPPEHLPVLKLDDLLPRTARPYIDVPDPIQIFSKKKPNKYTRAGQAALRAMKKA